MNKFIFILIGLMVLLPSSFVFADMMNSDYQSLGREWMQKMMGEGYGAYENEVKEMMGNDFFEKMQEFMGKSYQTGRGYLMMPMMNTFSRNCVYDNNWRGMMGGWGGSFWGWIMGFLMVLLGVVFFGIPVGVFVLLVVLIIKLIKSLR